MLPSAFTNRPSCCRPTVRNGRSPSRRPQLAASSCEATQVHDGEPAQPGRSRRSSGTGPRQAEAALAEICAENGCVASTTASNAEGARAQPGDAAEPADPHLAHGQPRPRDPAGERGEYVDPVLDEGSGQRPRLGGAAQDQHLHRRSPGGSTGRVAGTPPWPGRAGRPRRGAPRRGRRAGRAAARGRPGRTPARSRRAPSAGTTRGRRRPRANRAPSSRRPTRTAACRVTRPWWIS